MPATTLTRSRQPADAPQFVTKAGPTTKPLVLPPTLRARQAPRDQIEAAYRLARLAINLAAEQVPADQAERSLIAAAAERPQVLDLAADYLGYTDLTDRLADQVNALFMVEHARNRLLAGRTHALSARLARIAPPLLRRHSPTTLAATAS